MTVDEIIKLTKQLLPTGRAFRMAENSTLYRLIKALAVRESQMVNDAKSILNSAIPDNTQFTAEDATAWERRLGLITNESVSLDDRKLALIRKMNHPGTVPARSNYRFVEKQLRDAGFDVYIHENRFSDGMGGYITRTPEDVTGMAAQIVQHGDIQHGDAQHGGGVWDIIANYIDEDLDRVFNVGDNLRFTFFVGGPYPGDFANVENERKNEFRQLLLKAKPVNVVGYLFINYI